MEFYQEWLEQEPPTELFHYTSKDGFLGILQNKSLWASHILYQNDSSEFDLALSLLKEVIDKIPNVMNQWQIDSDTLYNSSVKFINKSIFVISLTENKDLLSQWRGYANTNPGYCIGFKRYYLQEIIKNNKFLLAKCIYDKKTQIKFIEEIIKDSFEKAKQVPVDKRESSLSVEIAYRIMQYAPLFKHETFAEECEWRIIITNISKSNPNLKIRSGKSYFIPYYVLPFKDQKAIGDIVIGPCADKKLVYSSTLFTCYQYDVEFVLSESRQLYESTIPFRNW